MCAPRPFYPPFGVEIMRAADTVLTRLARPYAPLGRVGDLVDQIAQPSILLILNQQIINIYI
jgi:hypothetical protein